MSWWSYKPYMSVAERRAKAAGEIEKLAKAGYKAQPVHHEGKKIARTFWGQAWCDNLDTYSDYDSRLPKGRTYVRNGSVCDLQIEPGRVTALVCGSELYKIKIGIEPVAPAQWDEIRRECAGGISSVIELLQGRLSQHVMEIITRPGSGLFPKPAEVKMNCSCPDWADMCKHVAAALYGVGARLDEKPELLFVLRQVNQLDLISEAGDIEALTKGKGTAKTIAAEALADVFGIEMEAPAIAKSVSVVPTVAAAVAKGKAATAKPARKGKRRKGAKPVAKRGKATGKTSKKAARKTTGARKSGA